ncbi:hypothetical protein PMAYCL1PPCAC_20485, partial [Pristionchus mayeri]
WLHSNEQTDPVARFTEQIEQCKCIVEFEDELYAKLMAGINYRENERNVIIDQVGTHYIWMVERREELARQVQNKKLEDMTKNENEWILNFIEKNKKAEDIKHVHFEAKRKLEGFIDQMQTIMDESLETYSRNCKALIDFSLECRNDESEFFISELKDVEKDKLDAYEKRMCKFIGRLGGLLFFQRGIARVELEETELRDIDLSDRVDDAINTLSCQLESREEELKLYRKDERDAIDKECQLLDAAYEQSMVLLSSELSEKYSDIDLTSYPKHIIGRGGEVWENIFLPFLYVIDI